MIVNFKIKGWPGILRFPNGESFVFAEDLDFGKAMYRGWLDKSPIVVSARMGDIQVLKTGVKTNHLAGVRAVRPYNRSKGSHDLSSFKCSPSYSFLSGKLSIYTGTI